MEQPTVTRHLLWSHRSSRFDRPKLIVPRLGAWGQIRAGDGFNVKDFRFGWYPCNSIVAFSAASLFGDAREPKWSDAPYAQRATVALSEQACSGCCPAYREITMGLQQAKIESLPFVTAELNYLAPTAAKPRTYAFDPPPGEPKTTALPEPHRIPIFDARPIAGSVSLDREGFAIVRHPTSVENFYDEKELKNVYYPAVEAFLRATLKADRVFIFDHTVRKRTEGAADVRGGGPRQPATRVHVDQTDLSGRNRVREHLPDEADELLKGRVQVINLWRPIRGPLLDAPLAMCDAQTLAPDDLVASDLIYPNRSGETYSVKFSPRHRWHYFPGMTADEALLLKCYDSATDGRARFAPHTAFIDPTTPAGAPLRESIEVRTLVFHKR